MSISTKNKWRKYSSPQNSNDKGLKGRTILLGVTGGIAAYKAVELTRLLLKGGARVQVVMTEAGARFVAPLTFEAITGRRVYVKMFPDNGEPLPWHTELATHCDLAVIAPASADHMAKLACGIADDLLTTTLLACEKPRVLCPAMNPRMWANPATQENLVTLKRRGYRIIPPEKGSMARPGEDDGEGRLAEPDTIYQTIEHILSAPQDLKSVRVLVTAGRTEESWDPVRVLTNRASGRMGFALAEEARERGADVVLIHGPTDVVPPTGVRRTAITTASQMTDSVMRELPYCQIVLMSAAVSDYTFEHTAEHKIKKGDPDPKIKLTPTTDILKEISKTKGNRIVVGFALETENVLENALKKLRDKHLDIVVANNPLSSGSGFQHETNQVFIIHRGGRVIDLPLQSKREVAREILNAVIDLYRNPEPEPEPEPEIDLDIEVEEEIHGRVQLAGLDTIDEPVSEPAQLDVLAESNNNGQGSRKSRSRRGGRRHRKSKDRGATPDASATEAPPVAEPVVEPAAVAAVAAEKAKASVEEKPKPKPSRKRATKKKTAEKKTEQAEEKPKKAAKKTATKKTATKKTAAKKPTRKTTKKKVASAAEQPAGETETS